MLSKKIPVAVSCNLVLLAMLGFTGVTVSDFKIGKNPPSSLSPHPASFKAKRLRVMSHMITARAGRFVGTVFSEFPLQFC